MSGWELISQRIAGGVFEAVIPSRTGAQPPDITVSYQGIAIPRAEVQKSGAKGQWALRVPIPAELLADGVQSFVIQEEGTGLTLGSFTIITGVPLEEDIRAEVDLLRAELEILKKEVRRLAHKRD